MASKRPNVYFLIYFPNLVLVLYSIAYLTNADMFYITIGLVHCEVKRTSKCVCILLSISGYKRMAFFPVVPIVLSGKNCPVCRHFVLLKALKDYGDCYV